MSGDGEDDFQNRDLNKEFEDLETKSSVKAAQSALEIGSGAIPFLGGLVAWLATNWSEQEQDRINEFFLAYLHMLQDEFKEKHKTFGEIVARVDLQDEKINERVKSSEYQRLFKKAFRKWDATESEQKRKIVRNILANAALAQTSSDDVVNLFLDWISLYSEFHFEVVSAIYNENGISRGAIWRKLEKPQVREDSADADLFKLVVRDLSMGSVIRQHREVDWQGNFVKKSRKPGSRGSSTLKSAFDEEEKYELTELGKQFVHYALNEITQKIEYTV